MRLVSLCFNVVALEDARVLEYPDNEHSFHVVRDAQRAFEESSGGTMVADMFLPQDKRTVLEIFYAKTELQEFIGTLLTIIKLNTIRKEMIKGDLQTGVEELAAKIASILACRASDVMAVLGRGQQHLSSSHVAVVLAEMIRVIYRSWHSVRLYS